MYIKIISSLYPLSTEKQSRSIVLAELFFELSDKMFAEESI